MPLITKIRKIGNSYGIIIPATVLRSLNWENLVELHVGHNADMLILTPYRYVDSKKFKEAAQTMFTKRAKLMQRLAKNE